ncbi:MAG: glycosyltransferase family 2 protein [Halioglobus sp.]
MEASTIYVVLLNWRGWQDTIACLQSVFASQSVQFKVIVCDNGSGDNSLENIEAWASGEINAEIPAHPRLVALLSDDGIKPDCRRINRATAESATYRVEAGLTLIDNGANLGFAAGNNVGLRLALSQADMSAVWLLNNDTLVAPNCLHAMQSELVASGGRSVIGSVIHFFDRPEVIQAIGGNRFNYVTGVAACSEGRFLQEDAIDLATIKDRSIDYLSGCSMLLPRAFLEEVGLMSEDYFLYYEEIDWFTRAKGQFSIQVAPAARLYHREGSAIGSPGWQRPASSFSDYHMQRSRLIFMRKHAPQWLLTCYLASFIDVGKRLVRGQVDNARSVLNAMMQRRGNWLPE